MRNDIVIEREPQMADRRFVIASPFYGSMQRYHIIAFANEAYAKGYVDLVRQDPIVSAVAITAREATMLLLASETGAGVGCYVDGPYGLPEAYKVESATDDLSDYQNTINGLVSSPVRLSLNAHKETASLLQVA